MEIRQYQPENLNSVTDLWERATQIGHPFLSREFVRAEKKNIPAVYIPNGDTWIASIDGSVVGFMILHGSELGALFVDPEFHGRGVGFALMNKAHALHNTLTVEVFKENSIGRKFYSRAGFSQVREYFHKESGMMMLCLEHTKTTEHV